MKKIATIAIDFDGVIHAYRKGWHDGTIYDGPIPGAREALAELLARGYVVVIYSTRNYDRTVRGVLQRGQVMEMVDWLAKHNIQYSRIHTEPGKPLCKLFVDDNAYRFDGEWNPGEVEEMERLIFEKHGDSRPL